MRKDMSKVIVERPRLGRSFKRKPGRTRPLEDDEGEPLRAREGKRKLEKTKNLNENLAPLRRFLEGQAGRPWDKVYAEIAENLRPSSTVQQHVRDHIEDFVAVKTRMQDSVVMCVDGRFGGVPRKLSEDYRKLFVHPKTGLLRRNPHWRSWSARIKANTAAAKAERDKRMRILSNTVQLHLLKDGAWWEVTLAVIGSRNVSLKARRGAPRPPEEPYTDVVFSAGLSDLAPGMLYGRPDVYAVEKRQLSKAEKKQHGL